MLPFTENLPYQSMGWHVNGSAPLFPFPDRYRRSAWSSLRRPRTFRSDVTATLDAADQGHRGPCAATPHGARCRTLPARSFRCSRTATGGPPTAWSASWKTCACSAMCWPTATSTPTKYKARYVELRDWLAKYGDLPEAPRIYALALNRQPAGASRPPRRRWPGQVPRHSGQQPGAHLLQLAGRPRRLAAWPDGRRPPASSKRWRPARTAMTGARAAGAFWAARSHLKAHQPEQVTQWLTEGCRVSAHLLRPARRAGRSAWISGLQWTSTPVQKTARPADPGDPRRRARAGPDPDRPERPGRKRDAPAAAGQSAARSWRRRMLAVAQAANLPSLSLRLGVQYRERRRARPCDTALYPIPTWEPQNGFLIDPALLFALMRQESGFNPEAKSPAGAIRPDAAHARDRRGHGRGGRPAGQASGAPWSIPRST